MEDVIPRIHSVPQNGWLDKANYIRIPKLTILIPDPDHKGEWKKWKPAQGKGSTVMVTG